MERRREERRDLLRIQLGQDVARGIGVGVRRRRRGGLEVGDAGAHAELRHGQVGGQLGQVLDGVARREVLFAHGQADFLEGFAARFARVFRAGCQLCRREGLLGRHLVMC